jgi:hypothetical protein
MRKLPEIQRDLFERGLKLIEHAYRLVSSSDQAPMTHRNHALAVALESVRRSRAFVRDEDLPADIAALRSKIAAFTTKQLN